MSRVALVPARPTAAAAAPSSTGKYLAQTWVTGGLSVSGPNSHPYAVERRSALSVSWLPTSQGTYYVYRSQDYTSRPITPGAIAAWRADGSPPLPEQSSPGRQVEKSAAMENFGNESLTAARLQALPTSTAGLEAAIVKGLRAKPPVNGYIPQGNLGIIDVCVGLVMDEPVTPAVRAAAFRILATMPGISLTGEGTDPLGRQGYGIALPGTLALAGGTPGVPGNNAVPKAQYRLVISPSGVVLANEDVAVTPTTNLVPVMPASGAIPGPTSCQAGQQRIGNECFIRNPAPTVLPSAPKGVRILAGPALEGPVLTLGAPILAVPAGTLVSYQAFLGSGLTNSVPSAAIPSLPSVSAASSPAPVSPS